MPATRRDFIKGLGASAVVLYAGDLIGNLLAQSPPGNPMQSKFKGLADIVLADAKMQGCSYADVRFTRTLSLPGANATHTNASGRSGGGGGAGAAGGEAPPDLAGFAGGGRGGGGFGRGGGSDGWRGARRARWRRQRAGRHADRGRLRRARDPQRRVGLREQPDRHRGRDSPHHAHRGGSRQGQRHREEERRRSSRPCRPTGRTGRRR